jgi:hypothetical protein
MQDDIFLQECILTAQNISAGRAFRIAGCTVLKVGVENMQRGSGLYVKEECGNGAKSEF